MPGAWFSLRLMLLFANALIIVPVLALLAYETRESCNRRVSTVLTD